MKYPKDYKVHNGRALTDFIEKCYQLYEQKMYQSAYRILQDSGWAEDAVQESFVKLMKGRVFFEDPESEECRKYLITVLRHSAIDIYNKKKREQKILCFTDSYDHERQPAPDSGKEEEDLRDLISVLEPKYYAVVESLAVKDLSVRETSDRLGISEANVRKRFERAKKILRKRLLNNSRKEYR